MKDFFISYNRNDRQWAEWIAWFLESEGYSVVLQAWDFRPGGNFILDMHKAVAETQKTIAVLSNTYLASTFTQSEWAATFLDDPQSIERRLIPVKVKECKPTGLLRPIVYVDLIGASESEAKEQLLKSLRNRVKPENQPSFPGNIETVEVAPELPITFPQPNLSLIDTFIERKTKKLEHRFVLLQEDWDALSDQLDAEDNDVRRNLFERKLLIVEKRIEKVVSELDSLSD